MFCENWFCSLTTVPQDMAHRRHGNCPRSEFWAVARPVTSLAYCHLEDQLGSPGSSWEVKEKPLGTAVTKEASVFLPKLLHTVLRSSVSQAGSRRESPSRAAVGASHGIRPARAPGLSSLHNRCISSSLQLPGSSSGGWEQ